MEYIYIGGDVFFLLIGVIFVFVMYGGFVFFEVGIVWYKNQVNVLVKIFVDFVLLMFVYFVIGFLIVYGIFFFVGVYELVGFVGGIVFGV